MFVMCVPFCDKETPAVLLTPKLVAMKKFFLFSFLFLLACACEKSHFDGDSPMASGSGVPHGMIVLGNQLDDPYSVSNMTKALQSLYPGSMPGGLEPTDYYVRFLPENQEQFDLLMSLDIELLDHPMDYEIVREGDYYVDPSVGEGKITWQYSVVGKDFDFPEGIHYEILDECFIAENAPSTKTSGIDWASVEEEAYRITGNEYAFLSTKAGDSAVPEGRITIVDSRYDSEPVGVAGVKVSCNSFVKFSSAFTDEEGYYIMKRPFSTDIRYRLIFKNVKGFGIGFNLLLVPASVSTLGKSTPEGVSVTVQEGSDKWLFARCAANNAGYDYYKSCSASGGKMKTPPSNLRMWLFGKLGFNVPLMMQQGAFVDNTMLGEILGENSPLVKIFLPDILIGLSDRPYDYSGIYSSVVHEMAHASHFAQVGTAYWDSYLRFVLTASVPFGAMSYGTGTEKDCGYAEICEMWAYYIQTIMMRDRYEGITGAFGTNYWFSPQIFLYLDDRALGRYRIFSALTEDVRNRDTLQERLLSLYPEEENTINQAFLRYL